MLLSSELDLLEVFQSGSQLSQVASQLPILLSQFVNLFPKKIHLINSRPITVGDVEEDLDAMVLFVQEVDLVLQLLHRALIGLMLIFLRQLVHVLSTLV